MNVQQTRSFMQQQKNLDANQRQALKKAIKALQKNPQLGKPQSGALNNLYLYRFGMLQKDWLLGIAYRFTESALVLLALHCQTKPISLV